MKTDPERNSGPDMGVPGLPGTIDYEEMESSEQDLSFDFTESVFRRKGLPFNEDIKRSLHIISNDRFTNLAYMLSDQFGYPAAAALFNDECNPRVLDRGEYTGSILEQLNEILRFIKIHDTLRSRISGISRIDEYAYPLDAVQEIAAEAFIRRDYSMNGMILVNMYPEHMSICSPGGSYFADDPKPDLFSIRNPNLAHIMCHLGYTKTFGTWIRNIMKSYDGYTQPIIRSTHSIFYVQLPSMINE